MNKKITDRLNKTIKEYVDLFCKKHDIDFDFWVADLSGTIGVFGDYFFSFEDIRLDLETNQPKDSIFKWYDLNLEMGMKNKHTINYYSWINGAVQEDDVFKDIVYDIKERFDSITYDTKICDLGDIGNEIGIALKKYIEEGKVGYELKNFINGVNHGINLPYKHQEFNSNPIESFIVFYKIDCGGGKIYSIVSSDKFKQYIEHHEDMLNEDGHDISEYTIDLEVKSIKFFGKEKNHYLYFGEYELNDFIR